MEAPGFGLELRRFRRRRGLSLRAMQSLVRYDFTYLGQVERGEKPGSMTLAATCDDALEAGGRLLALFQEESSYELGSDDTYAGSEGAVVPVDQVALMLPEQNVQVTPGGSGVSQIERQPWDRSELATLRALYHGTYSVGQLAHAVEKHLSDNTDHLAEADGMERAELIRERADSAMFAGRLALFDRWLPVAARGYLTMACEAAVVVEDHALAAGAFAHLAFVPLRERLGGGSGDYLEAARWHAERAGLPTLLSWVSAVEGEVRSAADPGAGLRAIDRAAELLDRPAPAPVPDWFDFYSPARLDGFRGQVLLAASRGDAARATLERSLESLEPGAVKQRAVLLADLAATYLYGRTPDVDQAVAEALRALEELRHTRYRAASDRLAGVRRRLEPWRASRPVREFDEALADVGTEPMAGVFPTALARSPRI